MLNEGTHCPRSTFNNHPSTGQRESLAANNNTVLIVGSVALDSVETPSGKVERALGGAAVYSSIAASFFSPVRLVGVVG